MMFNKSTTLCCHVIHGYSNRSVNDFNTKAQIKGITLIGKKTLRAMFNFVAI